MKVSVMGSHVGPRSAKTDIFCVLRPRPLLQVLWQVQVSGSAVFFLLDPALTPLRLLVVTFARLQVPPSRCHSLCGQRLGAESFSLSEFEDAKINAPDPCALSADVDGARRFENIGLHHVPELHGELDGAGDPLSAASSAHSPGAVNEVFTWFFRTFLRGKKCGVVSALGVGTECGLCFMDAGGFWRAHGARARAGV